MSRVIDGPSPEARERFDRMLLAFYDAEITLTTREAIDRLSDPMTRQDADSAIRRLLGAGFIGRVEDSHPQRWSVTGRGSIAAQGLADAGKTY